MKVTPSLQQALWVSRQALMSKEQNLAEQICEYLETIDQSTDSQVKAELNATVKEMKADLAEVLMASHILGRLNR